MITPLDGPILLAGIMQDVGAVLSICLGRSGMGQVSQALATALAFLKVAGGNVEME